MLVLKGMDSVITTDKIDLPDVGEILLYPMVGQADFEELKVIAPDSLKQILDKVNLVGGRKYVTVNMVVQFLNSEVTAAPRSNWHFDTETFEEDKTAIIHILSSETSAPTIFMGHDIELEEFGEDAEPAEVEVFMNKNLHLIEESVAIEPGRFYTFDGGRHFHAATRAKEPHFRFFVRVMESNCIAPEKEFIRNESFVFNDGIEDYTEITEDYVRNNKSEIYNSITHNSREIHVFYPKERRVM